MKKNIFKEGDLVRVIEITQCNNELILGDLHVVKSLTTYPSNGGPYVILYSWNRCKSGNDYYPYRFKKIKAGDLTPEELSSYIKYKFKIGVKL